MKQQIPLTAEQKREKTVIEKEAFRDVLWQLGKHDLVSRVQELAEFMVRNPEKEIDMCAEVDKLL